jgi:hypothetical protein
VTVFSRARRDEELAATLADPEAVARSLGEFEVPGDVVTWLGRLHTLHGVPFGYLVPDERQLPPESIRFFRLDDNWARALLDGAFSLGRNLTATTGAPSMNIDRAVLRTVLSAARAAAPLRRRRSGVATEPSATEPLLSLEKPWTGFLLRSRIVSAYPGLGVNVYPEGHTPDDPHPILLDIRRLDRLGPDADTLLCIVEGESCRVDVHEAPELLHFGIDRYDAHPGSAPTATKKLHKFRREDGGNVKISKETVEVPVGPSFRTRSPRVVSLVSVAEELARANAPGDEHFEATSEEITSAEMGFAMTEGVGMVSFLRRSA